MAQQPEFGLKRPPAYHWDMCLLGFLVSHAVLSRGQLYLRAGCAATC